MLQAEVRVLEDLTLQVSGTLAPGLDLAGFRRQLASPLLRLDGLAFPPVDTLADGALRYDATGTIEPDRAAGPLTLTAPAIDGVDAPPPGVTWAGLRRIGDDTVHLARGADLVLRVATSGGGDAAARRQWRLTVAGDSAATFLGGDGAPPDSIILPARYVPAGDTLAARLVWSVSARLEPPPGDYIVLLAGDTRVGWTVIVDDATGGAMR